ncbi:hypothetical protein [Paracoccus mutanolyticus]|uniref:hypothetical protein n=1 Tax=Paracoccus mutanolyticus TaxID=1499308 RepID=UPI0016750A1F|nr:hypothetical protein [Paracoccus mutanolyticus]
MHRDDGGVTMAVQILGNAHQFLSKPLEFNEQVEDDTDGFSGAYLATLVIEAACWPASKGRCGTMAPSADAVERIIPVGPAELRAQSARREIVDHHDIDHQLHRPAL